MKLLTLLLAAVAVDGKNLRVQVCSSAVWLSVQRWERDFSLHMHVDTHTHTHTHTLIHTNTACRHTHTHTYTHIHTHIHTHTLACASH